MTQILETTQFQIQAETHFTATYTDNFNNVTPTIADLAVISQQENPLQWVQIGDEIAAMDNTSNSNPWIIVHYGDAKVFNTKTLKEETQTGFFLQQKYYVPLTQAWTTSFGYLTMTDVFGTPNYIAFNMDDSEYFEYYIHPYFGAQKMWLPIEAQVLQSNAGHFSYYADTATYAARITSAVSSTPTTPATCTGAYAVYADSATNYRYFCSASGTTLSGSRRAYSSGPFYPRFCCFVKGKVKQEE